MLVLMEKKMTRASKILITAGVLFCISIIYENSQNISLLQKQSKSKLDFARYDTTRDRMRWDKRIQVVGPKNALTEMGQEYSITNDFRIQHTAEHIFGELLYERFGITGIRFCQVIFSYGCYHGFSGKAVIMEGIRVVSKISEACKGKFSCTHGVGHGILSYFGYTEEGLIKALNTCDTSNLSGVCQAGVFMEYNLRFFFHSPTVFTGDIRPVGNDLYIPCPSLSQRFLKACYYSQPDWWSIILHGDYSRIGQLCAALKKAELQKSCFHGIGKTITWFRIQRTGEIIQLCALMSDQNFILFCRSGAAQAVWERTQDVGFATRICEGFTNTDKKYCLLQTTRLPGF